MLTHWSYCSVALSHWYVNFMSDLCSTWATAVMHCQCYVELCRNGYWEYYVHYSVGTNGNYIRFWTHKRHPIPHPDRQTMGVFCKYFEEFDYGNLVWVFRINVLCCDQTKLQLAGGYFLRLHSRTQSSFRASP